MSRFGSNSSAYGITLTLCRERRAMAMTWRSGVDAASWSNFCCTFNFFWLRGLFCDRYKKRSIETFTRASLLLCARARAVLVPLPPLLLLPIRCWVGRSVTSVLAFARSCPAHAGTSTMVNLQRTSEPSPSTIYLLCFALQRREEKRTDSARFPSFYGDTVQNVKYMQWLALHNFMCMRRKIHRITALIKNLHSGVAWTSWILTEAGNPKQRSIRINNEHEIGRASCRERV